ncbi:putative protein phosphatase [Pseudolycoriella hygida]|uniref:protein-serine/threonine phosphatase n=1 Tax=Pseudolycoriella hygida TaxID=35572 RepID=A0A9Q0S3N6_9DIPT|nr:putative protein phosphatase [Pseudolycoriella hygida]
MGSYLSQPITEKVSADGQNEYISFGSSSMQGWRVSQEDAHNCCVDFAKDASFFAVYDGHGGAEVALYCAKKLPDFLKTVEAYQKGDFEQALKDAFIGFDSTLIDPDVVEELKKFAVDVGDGSETEDDADDEENLEELWEERDMELNAVLAKYGKEKANPAIEKVAGAKPSPFLKGRRNSPGEDNAAGTSSASSSNCVRRKLDDNEDAVSSTSKQKSEEIGEAASSSGSVSSKDEVASDPSSTNEKAKSVDCSPVSSSTSKNSNDIQMTNGDASTTKTTVSSQENEISTNSSKAEKVSSSSQSASQTNGDISSNTNDGPATNNSISSTKDFDSGDSTTDDDEYVEEEDEGFLNNMIEGPGQSSGCTAVVALLVGKELYVANAGDSRCVLCRGGKTIEMSLDHKPEDDEESTRITKAGGRVTMDGRVNGGLNLSRAIGDHAYKMNKDLKPEEQMISAMPDVKRITLEEGDEFMVLACDGIWNFMNSEEVVDFVRNRLAENRENLSSICEELFTNCLAPNTAGDGTGCDNMTAVIVQFKKILQQSDDEVPNSRKRVASPVSVSSDIEHNKRLKANDENNDAVAVIAEPTTS